MDNTNINQFTVRDIISSIFRKKVVIYITFCVIMIGVCIGLLLRTPVYEAKVKMHIKGVAQIATETYRGIGAIHIHTTDGNCKV